MISSCSGVRGGSPLPDAVAQRLAEPLARIATIAGEYLRAIARALASRRPRPPLAPFESTPTAYAADIAALRSEGLTRVLSSNDLERLFALGFAFEQLQQNYADLAQRVQEWGRPAAAK